MAWITRSWSSVGGVTRVAYELNDTSPTLAPLGNARTNSIAAFFAASIRVGTTSWAIMLRLTSMLNMTTVRLSGTGTGAMGRARVKITVHKVKR